MELTYEEQESNALDWIGMSIEPLEPGEKVDREQLKEQMTYTPADDEDIEAIAKLIEEETQKRQ